MLNLGGQAQRTGALPPFVEIRVSPVRDDYEGQQVRQSWANPTLTVSGTIITETCIGTYRQPWPKSTAG